MLVKEKGVTEITFKKNRDKSLKNGQSLKKSCTEFTVPEFPSLNLQSLKRKTLNFLTILAAARLVQERGALYRNRIESSFLDETQYD